MNLRLVDCGLVVISFIALLASFEGLSQVIGGNDWWLKAFCAVIAVGIGTGTFLVWHGAFPTTTLPLPRHRARGWATTIVGAAFILCFSAWFSAVALGGAEALRYDYDRVVILGQQKLAAASGSSPGIDSLLTGLEALEAEVSGLADCEFSNGCVSGQGGPGGVVGTLRNMATSVGTKTVALRRAKAERLRRYEDGKACLDDMRAAVSSGSDTETRREKLATGVDCLNAVLGDLAGGNADAEVRAALRTLTAGAVIPATVKTERQKAAVQSSLAAIQTKADAVAGNGSASEAATFETISLPNMNAMQAVIVNWHAIVPAWAAAIAIDLLPLLLVSYSSILAADRRERPEDTVRHWKVGDLEAAEKYIARNGSRRPALGETITLQRHVAVNPADPARGRSEWFGPDTER